MVILGLLLFAAAVVGGAEMAISNRAGDVGFEVFGYGLAASPATVFALGAVTMAVAVLGVFLVTGYAQRHRTTRREAKHRIRDEQTATRLGDVDRTNAELVAEVDRLRAELAAHERAEATMGGVTVPPGAGNVTYGDQVSDAVRSDTIAQTGRFDPYPADGASRDVRTDRERAADRDLERDEDKAGVLERFRGRD